MQIIYDFVKIFCLCDSQFHVSFIQVFLCMSTVFIYYIIVNSVLSRDRHFSLHEHRWMHLISPLDASTHPSLTTIYVNLLSLYFLSRIVQHPYIHTYHTYVLSLRVAWHDRWLVAFSTRRRIRPSQADKRRLPVTRTRPRSKCLYVIKHLF